MQYNDSYDEKIFSFANNINTVDGGTHLSGFSWLRSRGRSNNYAESSGLTKNAKVTLTGDDRSAGFGCRHQRQDTAAAVEGQTKGKLNRRSRVRSSRF